MWGSLISISCSPAGLHIVCTVKQVYWGTENTANQSRWGRLHASHDSWRKSGQEVSSNKLKGHRLVDRRCKCNVIVLFEIWRDGVTAKLCEPTNCGGVGVAPRCWGVNCCSVKCWHNRWPLCLAQPAQHWGAKQTKGICCSSWRALPYFWTLSELLAGSTSPSLSRSWMHTNGRPVHRIEMTGPLMIRHCAEGCCVWCPSGVYFCFFKFWG